MKISRTLDRFRVRFWYFHVPSHPLAFSITKYSFLFSHFLTYEKKNLSIKKYWKIIFIIYLVILILSKF